MVKCCISVYWVCVVGVFVGVVVGVVVFCVFISRFIYGSLGVEVWVMGIYGGFYGWDIGGIYIKFGIFGLVYVGEIIWW